MNLQQQSILNQSDSAAMQEFFDNPDVTHLSDNLFTFDWPNMDQKVNSEHLEGQFSHLDGFDLEAQTVQNPSLTLGGTASSNYQTHATNQHLHHDGQITGAPSNHMNGASDDDLQAANGLFSMFQNQSHASSLEASEGPSWGNIGVNNPNLPLHGLLQSPMTPSGRQSASSHRPNPLNPSTNNQYTNDVFSNLHMRHPSYHQQQMLQQLPHDRRRSLQVDTAGFNLFPQREDMQMPQTAHPRSNRPPPPMHFGSDDNFSSTGYRPPTGYGSHERQKAANLNDVPLAAQAAANGRGRSHMRNHFPMMGPSHNHQRYSVPGDSNIFPSISSPSTPFGGLPMSASSNSMAGVNRHGHPFPGMMQRSVEQYDEDDYEDDAIEDTKPRKRRKSQMHPDDDSEYAPSAHVNHSSKRHSKAAIAVEGSDDEYHETPVMNKASIKRRKSNAATRQSLHSSSSESPTGMTSPSEEPTTFTSKKKKNVANPRHNLTEEEKRRNHIQSEKHRRDLIKNQYDALDSMIPALKGGKSGLSRSDVLKEIVEFVEATTAGNSQFERLWQIPTSSTPASAGDPG